VVGQDLDVAVVRTKSQKLKLKCGRLGISVGKLGALSTAKLRQNPCPAALADDHIELQLSSRPSIPRPQPWAHSTNNGRQILHTQESRLPAPSLFVGLPPAMPLAPLSLSTQCTIARTPPSDPPTVTTPKTKPPQPQQQTQARHSPRRHTPTPKPQHAIRPAAAADDAGGCRRGPEERGAHRGDMDRDAEHADGRCS